MLTKLIFTVLAADAAYIYFTVARMAEDASMAAERYHAVPLMTEHILSAVVIYLAAMILIRKNLKS
ncbi:MAG: hypothetical protein E7638_06430 [Ruminococcaceae bacterium]|nr:hypothetical protein [Oscillospiraceae bacterium]